MGKVNRVTEGELRFAVREDGERICEDCMYKRGCSDKGNIEKYYDEGVIAKVQACTMYEEKPENTTKKKFFGDLT